jgi:hypothetical protein
MRRDCAPTDCTTSSASANTPGWLGTSSKPKLDSQWNQRDQFISIRLSPPKARLSSTGWAGDAHTKIFKFTAIIVSGGTSDAG